MLVFRFIHLQGHRGTLSDGSNAGSPYSGNRNCRFIIEVDISGPIQLNFSRFDTEKNHDMLIIYDGPDEFKNNEIGQFSAPSQEMLGARVGPVRGVGLSTQTSRRVGGPGKRTGDPCRGRKRLLLPFREVDADFALPFAKGPQLARSHQQYAIRRLHTPCSAAA